MNPKDRERVLRVAREKVKRAKELIAHAETLGIEIGWEGEYTTFTPMTAAPPRFIEEATILSGFIKAIKEGKIK